MKKSDISDFEIFKQQSVSLSLSRQKQMQVYFSNEMQPSWVELFLIVGILHTISGFVSLVVCHQFGMNPFSTSFSIDHFFMQWWGHQLCLFACGLFFFGFTQWVMSILMSPIQWRKWNSAFSLPTVFLILLTLVLFRSFSSEVSLSLAILWAAGAWCAHFLVWELPRWYRFGYRDL